MQHKPKDEFEMEVLISLLYQISDVLHTCEEALARALEPNLSLCEILSSAQSRTVTLLAHASKRQQYSYNGECESQSALGSRASCLLH